MHNTILRTRLLTMWLIIIASSTVTFANDSIRNGNIHGFRLIEKKFVKEVNSYCYHFEHIQSGAQLLKIAASDRNKTFCIAFHTISESDCGTAHILEHSVLNGSENFPVKSPFDLIMKGSLKTFVNAFTGKDMTFYPVASMNEKDYFNLMHIYLDAVFNPLLHKDPNIFKQEGWHYELGSEEDPVVYRGVVYGEMHGAYSGPGRYLSRYTYKHLFPDNGYGFESGGYPSAIPDLTYKEFTEYHKKYYHPDNSYIILFGDADLSKELEFINTNYLSKFSKTNRKIVIEPQKPFEGIKTVEEYYPVLEGTNNSNQTFISMNFVYGSGTDKKTSVGLSLIADLLFNGEDAPVRLALQKAGIGSELNAGISSFQQNVFQIKIQNADRNDQHRFREIIIDELKTAAIKGFDTSRLVSFLNRYEFNLREDNDAQKGVNLIKKILPGFIHQKDPFLGLEYENLLLELKKDIYTTWLTDLLVQALIKNPHTLILVLSPKPGLDIQWRKETTDRLSEFKDNLSKEEINQLIKETNELIAYQKRVDEQAAIDKIPLLSLKDVNTVATCHEALPKAINGLNTLHYETFTNGIIYCNFFFDMRVLPEKLIPYASLLTEMLTSLNTGNYNYRDLDIALNNNTGGFYTYLTKYFENNNDEKMIPKLVVATKSLSEKTADMLDLTAEILMNTKYDDPELINTLIDRIFARVENSIRSDGATLANIRLRSYFTNGGRFDDLTSGYSYYLFLKDLAETYPLKKDEIINNLIMTAKLIAKKTNLTIGVSCSKIDYEIFEKKLHLFSDKLSETTPEYYIWNLNPDPLNEAFQAASTVQYVYSGNNFKKLGYEWNGGLLVLNRIISREWLNQKIRIVGGAYGGYSIINPNGIVMFVSYRDPNLAETYKCFSNTTNFLKSYNPAPRELERYILGTISSLDQPKSTSSQGSTAFFNYFTGLTCADYQKERNEVLATSTLDISSYATMIEKVLDENIRCVYGNEKQINDNIQFFNKIIRI